ncbi:hypothetical protein [Absidia glauca]|uniref:Uncharacterized protein n=1 Tax=Absidia glauca TaxID=4829 RepID=A0A168RS23_ABSGL|nr:hypothetical protein [Absidia glauca]
MGWGQGLALRMIRTGECGPTISKVPVVVGRGSGQRDVVLQQRNGQGIYNGNVGDIKLCSSRHHRRRRRCYRRHRRSRSNVEKKKNQCKKANVSQGKTKMDKMVRRRELSCVRRSWSLGRGRVVRDAVRIFSGKKKKVMKKQRRSTEMNGTEK